MLFNITKTLIVQIKYDLKDQFRKQNLKDQSNK